jgi:hypothetical protein
MIIDHLLAVRPGVRGLAVIATKARFPTDETPNGHGSPAVTSPWFWMPR